MKLGSSISQHRVVAVAYELNPEDQSGSLRTQIDEIIGKAFECARFYRFANTLHKRLIVMQVMNSV